MLLEQLAPQVILVQELLEILAPLVPQAQLVILAPLVILALLALEKQEQQVILE